MSAPTAPAALGRGVIVGVGAAVPDAWRDAPVVEIDAAVLSEPAAAVATLHGHWLAREPVVCALAVDPARFREPERVTAPVFSLAADLDLPLDRLHHLVWANNIDARSGEPVWWWTAKAERLGASPGAEADVVLADGAEAWIDGGPRWSVPTLDAAVVHASSVEAGRMALVPADPAAPTAGELAPDQLAAVAYPGGPVRVIAPAGSGKTRVLTERVRHLLADRGYERKELLAVAYNKQAQREMEDRLADVEPRTRTLNSLGYAILGRHRGSRPPLLDEPEVRRLIDDVFPIPRRRLTNTDPVGPYLDALTSVRLGLRDPGEVEDGRDDVPGFADGFDAYRERLGERGAVDFDEQIYGALEALLRDGAFRRSIQAEHRHLLVDEFQDLTPAHVLLIRLLAMPALDVFGVGDDDQTIYDHAGADPRFLVDYRDYFAGAGATALEVNYRCAEAIVTGAATLLGYNRVRVDKQIRAVAGADPDPGALAIEPHAAGDAATAAVGLVRGWLEDDDADPGEIAVLARVNSLLLAPQIALWAGGVPVISSIRADVLERTGMAGALAWLRVAVDPEGLIPADLETIRRRPSRGFPQWIGKWFDRCRTVSDLRGVERRLDDERVSAKVGELAGDIELLAERAGSGATTRELLEFVRDRIGLGGAMEMLDGSKGTEAAASHLDDLEGLIQVADLHPDPALFEPWLRASLESSTAGNRGVTLSTVHRVKGREWDRVAVFGVTEGLMPHRLSLDVEAERRVLHVAITRARKRCVVLGDAGRRSPFLDELRGTAERAAVRERPVAAPATGTGRRKTVKPLPLPPGGAAPEAEAADAALRQWRTARASRDAVPPYVVLSNRSLEGIAARMPADAGALLACEGIGPTKLERYSEEILAVLDSVRG